MSTNIEKLKDWFDDLPQSEQKEVVKFLYGGKMLLQEGMYLGPHPDSVQRGLHVGPIPSSSSGKCPTCGRPY